LSKKITTKPTSRKGERKTQAQKFWDSQIAEGRQSRPRCHGFVLSRGIAGFAFALYNPRKQATGKYAIRKQFMDLIEEFMLDIG